MSETHVFASQTELKGFEDLFARFQSTSESLERSYRQLQDRVLQLSAELEEEREQRIRLERLAAMGELAMELAHEIRNPLGSIELYASMIDGPYAGQIVRSVRLLDHSVTNILQFGQPVHPDIREFPAAALIEGICTFLQPMAAQKGVSILAVAGPDVSGEGDFELLHRALLNLVLNALRELPEGGTITLAAEPAPAGTRILVADDGPGIPVETLSRIFDPMFSTSRTGCGLGLPIVKRIVESHAGAIDVQSSSEGTCFEIRLPARPVGAFVHAGGSK